MHVTDMIYCSGRPQMGLIVVCYGCVQEMFWGRCCIMAISIRAKLEREEFGHCVICLLRAEVLFM